MGSEETLIAYIRQALEIGPDADGDLAPLAGRGSDRAYFRFRWGSGKSVILMQYQPTRVENAYYAAIARFLSDIGIPVPRVLHHDSTRRLILQEDLGETDLWTLRESPWDIRHPLYMKTLESAHLLHSFPESRFPGSSVPLMDPFGPELYRWERDYFRERFVAGLCRVRLESGLEEALEKELHGLARKLAADRRSLVHRDLQSQNVMVRGGGIFLIDFQGMRFGSRFYDLSSLLCDPYTEWTEPGRMELLSYYYGLSEPEMAWDDFSGRFWEAAAQRLMQALGAYGFLGQVKGLRAYLQHVRPGLRNLCTAAEKTGALPRLLDVCRRCETALKGFGF